MKKAAVAVVVIALVATVFVLLNRPEEVGERVSGTLEVSPVRSVGHSVPTRKRPKGGIAHVRAPFPKQADEIVDDGDGRLVEAFEETVEAYRDARPEPPSAREIVDFIAGFVALPEEQRDTCLQMALNLIPDENYSLLEGLMASRAVSAEHSESVFNDLLNRPADLKDPVLERIAADRNHPCHADAAWVLDVTHEK